MQTDHYVESIEYIPTWGQQEEVKRQKAEEGSEGRRLYLGLLKRYLTCSWSGYENNLGQESREEGRKKRRTEEKKERKKEGKKEGRKERRKERNKELRGWSEWDTV